jgi:hypothetical protein
MTDGDSSYGCDAVVKIKGGSAISEETIEKLLINEVIKTEFGEPNDPDIEVDSDNSKRIWECGHERCCELNGWKKISINHFEILKQYIVNHEFDAPKETFTLS